jgi:hypothetical protein
MKKRSPLAISVLLLVIATSHSFGAPIFDIGSGDVSRLIAVINLVNDEATNPGPYTINLKGGTYGLTEPVDMADGANGLPSISSEITINGADDTTNPTIIERAAGAPSFRIFCVAPEGILILNNKRCWSLAN